MKTLEEIKYILSGHREELRQNYEVKDIGIFGSVAGESRKRKAMWTFLVDFGGPICLLRSVHLQNYLNDIPLFCSQ